MHAELRLNLPLLYGFLIALARVSGVVAFTPIPGLRDAPQVPRVILALALTFVLLPAWPSVTAEEAASATGLAVSVVSEFSIGLLIGLTVSVLLEGIQLAAQMIGLPAGFSYASTVDPSTQADSSVLQIVMQLFGGLLFFALGFDRQVIRILLRSFEALPAGAYPFRALPYQTIVRMSSTIFTTGLRLALPVLALMVLLDIAVAVLGRVQAQLQLLPLSFLLKMLGSLGMLASALAFYPQLIESTGNRLFTALGRLLAP
jgi:flagellar biosynthetic protein FliR